MVVAGVVVAIASVVALRSGTGGVPAGAANASPMGPILLDPVIGARFDPPPPGTVPALTAEEAIGRFASVDKEFSLPVDATIQPGLFTAPVGDSTYLFKDRLAWGISYHECASFQGNPEHRAPSSGSRVQVLAVPRRQHGRDARGLQSALSPITRPGRARTPC